MCRKTFMLFLLIDNFERRVLRIERTTAVHSRYSGPVLCKTITHFFNFIFANVVSFKSVGCINLGWSVSKAVHCRVLDLPGGEKT